MEKQEILNLIEISPLDEVKKKELQELLETEGAHKDFYDRFNEYMVQKLKENETAFWKILTEYDAKIEEMEKELQQKKQILEAEIQKDLSLLKPTDQQKKTQLWEKYYAEIEKIWTSYESKLKTTFSSLFATII